jgi:DNA-binding MarR family transcriptional regulator
MPKRIKTCRELERIARGFSNHRRIQLLGVLDRKPEMSIQELASDVRSNFRNISIHVQRMHIAGLVQKRNEGRAVRHRLTPRGRRTLAFLNSLD